MPEHLLTCSSWGLSLCAGCLTLLSALQVVVDSESTAKALLANGQLRNRVTIIPLNKVSSRDIAPPARAAARKMAGDKAQPALELVGYQEELAAAMKYAFGGSFVCKVGLLPAACCPCGCAAPLPPVEAAGGASWGMTTLPACRMPAPPRSLPSAAR